MVFVASCTFVSSVSVVRLATPEKSLQFLRDVLKTLTDTSTSKGKVVDQEAVTLCELEIILVRVFQGDVEELRDDLERCKSYIDDFPGIMDALVYASYYNTALEYHRVRLTTLGCGFAAVCVAVFVFDDATS